MLHGLGHLGLSTLGQSVKHRKITFDQCQLGQLVPKSTTLSTDLDLHHWADMRCQHPEQPRLADIISSDLSRYPWKMMQGLAQAIATRAKDTLITATLGVSPLGSTYPVPKIPSTQTPTEPPRGEYKPPMDHQVLPTTPKDQDTTEPRAVTGSRFSTHTLGTRDAAPRRAPTAPTTQVPTVLSEMGAMCQQPPQGDETGTIHLTNQIQSKQRAQGPFFANIWNPNKSRQHQHQHPTNSPT
jgi:hypothetical protein